MPSWPYPLQQLFAPLRLRGETQTIFSKRIRALVAIFSNNSLRPSVLAVKPTLSIQKKFVHSRPFSLKIFSKLIPTTYKIVHFVSSSAVENTRYISTALDMTKIQLDYTEIVFPIIHDSSDRTDEVICGHPY